MNPDDARAPEASGADEAEPSPADHPNPEAQSAGPGGADASANQAVAESLHAGESGAGRAMLDAGAASEAAAASADSAIPDSAIPDSAIPDSAIPDSAIPDSAAPDSAHEHAHGTPSQLPLPGQPTFLLFGLVASASLLLDVVTKGWAEVTLVNRPTTPITLIEDHLSLTLAYNPGGAWGLLTSQSEDIRKPFFVFVSVAAILFIVSLYGRLAPGQRALMWGLPLVLGGALGNLADRITRSQVIDFIDYRADWVRSMNELVAKYMSSWSVTDHWPTFNVADIAICVGVGLMAIDMVTSRRGPHPKRGAPPEIVPAEGPQPEGPQPQS